MEMKYLSWFIIIGGISIHIIGFFWCLTFILGLLSFILGFLSILYLQHCDVETFLSSGTQEHPLEATKTLGLNFVSDQKPIMLISPNIQIQTESKKLKTLGGGDNRKKSILDSGLELLFKKHTKLGNKDGQTASVTSTSSKTYVTDHLHKLGPFRGEPILENRDGHGHQEEKKWKPFDIKIYTERKKSTETVEFRKNDGNVDDIQFGEECSGSADKKQQQKTSSPNKLNKTILSGNKSIDKLLHTIIDYILRDFIDSWYTSISNNREFTDERVRNCIELCVKNICNRIKNTNWMPLLTTKLIDDLASHTRLYRLAGQSIIIENKNDEQRKFNEKLSSTSPQRKSKGHRRNKSDTDLNWYLGNTAVQKNIANSKFYTGINDEMTIIDPEIRLLNALFDQCDLYKDECLDNKALEKYLTHLMETILYFTLPEEEFGCYPLRTFLATLLGNVLLKPLLELLSDPDFINLQVARVFSKDPPPGEFLIKMIRQCSDLSELRACRQLITKEMDLKFKESNNNAELASLKYAQKLIDLRISHLQNKAGGFESIKPERDRSTNINLPILTLDEILTKELALSYYLDYLSILNLQKYVIFYLTAQEWKLTTTQCLLDAQTNNKVKGTKDNLYKMIRDKANNILKEYLHTTATNSLNIDNGLVEVLNIKINDLTLIPDNTWFDSLCKFIYEKLKNEELFLNLFYQSSAYKKLLLELDVCGGQINDNLDIDINLSHLNVDGGSVGGGSSISGCGSDSNSGDIPYDEIDDGDCMIINEETHKYHYSGGSSCLPEVKLIESPSSNLLAKTFDLSVLPGIVDNNLLLLNDNINNFKHSRSHSDCTTITKNFNDNGNTIGATNVPAAADDVDGKFKLLQTREPSKLSTLPTVTGLVGSNNNLDLTRTTDDEQSQQKITAKIINTAINSEGQYAVYAIQVSVIELNQHKSWHIYRRYSKFLELKKTLVKRFPNLSRIPFPAKKAFQNTQRTVLEHRMNILNEFLKEICIRSSTEHNEIYNIIREFLEPDTNDKKIHGGAVVRTIETLVNPLKYGMRTIRNMPDNLVGGISKILLGRGPMKEPSFLGVTAIPLEQSSDYPALTSALNLLDEVFDLQSRSQWLRRGIINRLLGAPWVSHTANKKILHTAKSLIELDKVELLLTAVLNNIWPNGKREKRQTQREDNTKLRTKMAAKVSLFALLSDDLRHVVGSETTRSGLLNIFEMCQHKKINLRLILVLLNDILTLLYQVDNMTKHVQDQD